MKIYNLEIPKTFLSQAGGWDEMRSWWKSAVQRKKSEDSFHTGPKKSKLKALLV